jgi:hypothetical protein
MGLALALDEKDGILIGGYWGDSPDLHSILLQRTFLACLLPPPAP